MINVDKIAIINSFIKVTTLIKEVRDEFANQVDKLTQSKMDSEIDDSNTDSLTTTLSAKKIKDYVSEKLVELVTNENAREETVLEMVNAIKAQLADKDGLLVTNAEQTLTKTQKEQVLANLGIDKAFLVNLLVDDEATADSKNVLSAKKVSDLISGLKVGYSIDEVVTDEELETMLEDNMFVPKPAKAHQRLVSVEQDGEVVLVWEDVPAEASVEPSNEVKEEEPVVVPPSDVDAPEAPVVPPVVSDEETDVVPPQPQPQPVPEEKEEESELPVTDEGDTQAKPEVTEDQGTNVQGEEEVANDQGTDVATDAPQEADAEQPVDAQEGPQVEGQDTEVDAGTQDADAQVGEEVSNVEGNEDQANPEGSDQVDSEVGVSDPAPEVAPNEEGSLDAPSDVASQPEEATDGQVDPQADSLTEEEGGLTTEVNDELDIGIVTSEVDGDLEEPASSPDTIDVLEPAVGEEEPVNNLDGTEPNGEVDGTQGGDNLEEQPIGVTPDAQDTDAAPEENLGEGAVAAKPATSERQINTEAVNEFVSKHLGTGGFASQGNYFFKVGRRQADTDVVEFEVSQAYSLQTGETIDDVMNDVVNDQRDGRYHAVKFDVALGEYGVTTKYNYDQFLLITTDDSTSMEIPYGVEFELDSSLTEFEQMVVAKGTPTPRI